MEIQRRDEMKENNYIEHHFYVLKLQCRASHDLAKNAMACIELRYTIFQECSLLDEC